MGLTEFIILLHMPKPFIEIPIRSIVFQTNHYVSIHQNVRLSHDTSAVFTMSHVKMQGPNVSIMSALLFAKAHLLSLIFNDDNLIN